MESSNWLVCHVGCGVISHKLSLHSALALKGIDYEYRAVHLLKDGGEQVSTAGRVYGAVMLHE